LFDAISAMARIDCWRSSLRTRGLLRAAKGLATGLLGETCVEKHPQAVSLVTDIPAWMVQGAHQPKDLALGSHGSASSWLMRPLVARTVNQHLSRDAVVTNSRRQRNSAAHGS
jgi:hypothetical protein